MNQATSLQSLYVRMTEKAFLAIQLPHFDSFMRMALRAHNQCRATLETLSAIKNPPVVIAKQATIVQGHPQVNNGTAFFSAQAHARENQIQQNELLAEAKHEETVDTRAAGTVNADQGSGSRGKRPQVHIHERVRRRQHVTPTKVASVLYCENCHGY
jgi:hypothetical protein